MDTLATIDNAIIEIEEKIPKYLYAIFSNNSVQQHIQLLRMIDEQLSQYILSLDTLSIDKIFRKERIIKMQHIQTTIEKVVVLADNQQIYSNTVNELYKMLTEQQARITILLESAKQALSK